MVTLICLVVTENHKSLQDWAPKKDNSRLYLFYTQPPAT